ncbi:hypothetical protein OESDEN_02350 [Oesophagostomum dentatum]|uniref:CHK kinase-like domain-containing protein n=1 Tax=Oesophagostomum dentatum TaxID=61180 RepID=A0A0B1TQN4_OESDE|nr:hypothetical protein OESDEN_02350 [Oesophagostomum dentatum]
MGDTLASVGTGLFQTHINWEDIEQCIQDERKTEVHFGPKKKAYQIGSGNGFLSRIGVIDADFQGETNGLPQKFILKVLSFLESIEYGELVAEREDMDLEEMFAGMDEQARILHNREVNVYRAFSRFDNSLTKLPLYYFGQEFVGENKLKGFIGMEFVENAEIRHFFHNVRAEELSEVIRALAFLQAKSLQFSDEQRQKLASNQIPDVYSVTMPPRVVSKALRNLYTTSEELRASGEVLEKMTEELLDLDLTNRINKELGMKDVFVHGDLWSANLLWTKTVNGVKLSRIIDHQGAHFGCGAEDLCRVFISTLSGKDRRENWERLLGEFHGYLVQYCEEEPPFTLEQLKEAYRRLFPLAGMLLSDVFEGIMKIALRRVPDEERIEAENTLSEKILALFEDMVSLAERNRKVMKQCRTLTGDNN